MPNNQLSSIQHIVHLMLENRSFDHMLGFLYPDKTGPGGVPFEGLMGTESNPDGNGNSVAVYQIDATQPGGYFMPGADPGEGYANTNSQLFGTGKQPVPPVATMQGFVTNYAAAIKFDQQINQTVQTGTVPSDIMGIFPPEALPVLSGLAKGFAVCDHWYSSVPTETFPNRAFACAGTSQGHMNDSNSSYTVRSIFGLMTTNKNTWKIYGYDAEPLTRGNFPDTSGAPDTNFGKFPAFQADAAAGTLAQYSFLEPSWGSSGNSQHPNYDVALGEALILQVYRALQAGPAWNQTLLIISYDEHGGCFDHVPPPSGAVPPDDSVGEFGFDFKRFGVRVPAVLVSPLIAPGTIFNVPAGTMPIDHTSVLKTIEVRWGLTALTARDAAAPDLGNVLTLSTPRTDDPLAGVVAPTSSGANPAAGEVSHLQQLHAQMISDLPVPDEQLIGQPVLPNQHTPADLAHYISARTSTWMSARDAGQAPAGARAEPGQGPAE
ncbi:MAG TPA: alkaline phosphatase family protein [Streptosporangiaceae bacterium]|nr:alkaline phosphatase family protein [Streptosporangiaceae bacterium]